MTAAARDIKTDQYGTPDVVLPQLLNFPVAAATTIYAGTMVGTDGSGNAVPASAIATLKLWGRAERQVVNTTAAGFGNAGDLRVEVHAGVFYFNNDTTNAVTNSNRGAYVFAVDDNVVGTSDLGGTLPLAGYVIDVPASGQPEYGKVAVAVGIARPDALNPELGGGGSAAFKARGVVTANVATPTAASAFTVAGNDGLTYVAGQVVLLTGQTTASQNGPYVVGVVATGTAALKRPDWFPAGGTAQAASRFEVSEGIIGANSAWQITTAAPITIDTTAITIASVQQSAQPMPAGIHYVRGVVTANIATPTAASAFTVASNDGLTYVQGQRVLLVGQTTASQNGPYVVGVVATGTAALIRPVDWLTGSVQPGAALFSVGEGTQGANSQWICRTAGAVTVDTTAINIDMQGGNWVQGVSTAVGTMAGPSGYFFAAAQLKARLSGIFEVELDVGWSCGTTADSVTMALVTDTVADGAGAVIASANKVNHGVTGFGTYGTRGADWESVDTNAGAVLTFNAAAFNTAGVTQASEVNGTLTGLLTANGSSQQKFSVKAIVYNAAPTGTTKTPFTIGNQVAFGVKVTATNTITVPTVRLTVKELPAQ